MTSIVISGSGLYTPPFAVSNEELVAAFNQYVDLYNEENASAIDAGQLPAKQHSSCEFIEKASGIKSRHLVSREGVLDPDIMQPLLAERPDDQPSIMVEMAVAAAEQALIAAGREPGEIDLVIVAASNMPRPYPALSIELQHYLGAGGMAFDMNVACSSATFGIKTAADFVASGSVKAVLMVNPEICSAHLNFKDRDSHFIFGDVATAVIIEAEDQAGPGGWDILGTKLKTSFSNNIRNNFGFLNRAALPTGASEPVSSDGLSDKMFVQQGRKVFKEVVPMVSEMILDHAAELNLDPHGLKRMWLHQANINMNTLIGKKVLGREPEAEENVIILDDYANTSSAGSIIAFHLQNDGFAPGDTGLICSFGAGYSAGTVFVQKRP